MDRSSIFFQKLTSVISCEHCKYILVDPIMTKCHHFLCKNCFSPKLKECPVCHIFLFSHDMKPRQDLLAVLNQCPKNIHCSLIDIKCLKSNLKTDVDFIDRTEQKCQVAIKPLGLSQMLKNDKQWKFKTFKKSSKQINNFVNKEKIPVGKKNIYKVSRVVAISKIKKNITKAQSNSKATSLEDVQFNQINYLYPLSSKCDGENDSFYQSKKPLPKNEINQQPLPTYCKLNQIKCNATKTLANQTSHDNDKPVEKLKLSINKKCNKPILLTKQKASIYQRLHYNYKVQRKLFQQIKKLEKAQLLIIKEISELKATTLLNFQKQSIKLSHEQVLPVQSDSKSFIQNSPKCDLVSGPFSHLKHQGSLNQLSLLTPKPQAILYKAHTSPLNIKCPSPTIILNATNQNEKILYNIHKDTNIEEVMDKSKDSPEVVQCTPDKYASEAILSNISQELLHPLMSSNLENEEKEDLSNVADVLHLKVAQINKNVECKKLKNGFGEPIECSPLMEIDSYFTNGPEKYSSISDNTSESIPLSASLKEMESNKTADFNFLNEQPVAVSNSIKEISKLDTNILTNDTLKNVEAIKLGGGCHYDSDKENRDPNSIGGTPLEQNFIIDKEEQKTFAKHANDIIENNDNQLICSIQGTEVTRCSPKLHNNIVIITSGISGTDLNTINKFLTKFSVCLLPKYHDKVSHVIVKTNKSLKCERTLKYFMGIAGKKWIIAFEWVVACLNANRLLNEEPFEVRGDTLTETETFAPKISRLAGLTESSGSHKDLLKGFHVCCLGNFTPDLPVNDMKVLLMLCGALISTNYKFNIHKLAHGKRIMNDRALVYVVIAQPEIGSDKINTQMNETFFNEIYKKHHAFPLAREWVFDCVALYKLVPMIHYLLCQPQILKFEDLQYVNNMIPK